mgnify:CR=1 FL=1
MPVLKIIHPSNPVLRKKAAQVNVFDTGLQNLIDDMIETMQAAPGVGLAAPQVSESMRLFVARLEEEPVDEVDLDAPKASMVPGLGRTHVMINPKITRFIGEDVVGTEACLSIPGFLGDVTRSNAIIIKYLDRQGQRRKLRTHGWLARVLQHEYDHLDGILFIDRAEKVWRSDSEKRASAE